MVDTTLAVGIGPYIGGLLYDEFESYGCFIVAAIFSLIALILINIIDINQIDLKITLPKDN